MIMMILGLRENPISGEGERGEVSESNPRRLILWQPPINHSI